MIRILQRAALAAAVLALGACAVVPDGYYDGGYYGGYYPPPAPVMVAPAPVIVGPSLHFGVRGGPRHHHHHRHHDRRGYGRH